MSSPCNILNVNQIKVSDLVRYNSITTKDLILTIESGSNNKLYSRRSTFGDVVGFLSSITGSYSGSFSGSIKARGSFTGSVLGTLNGQFTGSATGSFNGIHTGKSFTTGSLTGSFKGKASGSFSGSYWGKIISKNTVASGSFSGSYWGRIISKNIKASGSFSGSTWGGVISKNIKASGSFSGSTYGNILSKNATLSGRLTGSVLGYISGSSIYNSNQKVAFFGTSSWSKNANSAQIAVTSTGNPTGTGTTNYFTYWTGVNSLAGTPYLTIDSTKTNITPMTSPGRVSVTRPLHFSTLGEQIIQYSASIELYEMGIQQANNYIRTGKNFTIFYSGSYVESSYFGPKDAYWNPDKTNNVGKSGFTVLGVRQRCVGIGHFTKSDQVDAQAHIHLSSSYGWASGYNPNANVFLITSGSGMTKLLRVNGNGQLDVRGDIVAFSTFSTSDERLKSNISPIENALEKVDEIKPVEFTWKHSDKKDYGVIAQQIEQLYPDFVTENMDGYKVVKYNPLIALLLKSVQELKTEIELLKQKLK